MRPLAAAFTVLLLAAAVAFNLRSEEKSDRATEPDKVHWIKLTFGLDGKSVAWDGSVTVREGRVLESAPWSFEKRDRYDPASHKWFCSTVVVEGRNASSFAEPQRGVLVRIERDGATQLDVETRQGNFTVDPAELRAGVPQTFLDGRASAELLGTSQTLPDRAFDSDAATEDDHPALAIDAKGHRWLAWVAYDDEAKRDRLRVLDFDDPAAKTAEISTAREQASPQLLTDADGTLWLFWAAPEGDNWDLWAAKRSQPKGRGAGFQPARKARQVKNLPHGGWSAPQRLTTAEGSDFHLAAARGPKGEIWLAWQAFRDGNSDILARRLHDGRWSQEIAVADNPANEWEPSISVDPRGTAWIGYDSYRNGNYDVFLTSVTIDSDGRPRRGEMIPVAATADFEAHASVEAAGEGAVWVAYDAAGPNWGKDFTRVETEFKGRYAEPLHASRRLGLRALKDGKLMKPGVPLPQRLTKLHPDRVDHHSAPQEITRFYELPRLARDGDGRLWVFFRVNRQGYAGHPKMGANWEFYATTFADGEWLEPILLPPSKGRQNQRVSTAAGKDGRLHVAWATGDHHVDLPFRVRIGKLPPVASRADEPQLVPAEATPGERVASKSEPLVRSWKLHHKGARYQVYFGDLHRHTDTSLCTPTIDGCLVDAYRYALDAARLDFLAVTDHTRDTDPYPWWRTQKANDLFHVKGTFAPIYAYERSNGIAGGGHRNVFFLERDWPVYRGDAHYSASGEKRPENNNPDVALYPHLRGKNALTAAHTPGFDRKSGRGTWTYHDPQVEPIAEIIQTYRRDYERPGAPEWRDARIRGKIAEEASLWYALARGHKLGFIASSDHHSTHMSYACVWAKGPGREEIFEALKNRRTYAATDKILLEFRLGDAVVGEETEASERPELTIKARGTAPIEEVQIVRNRTVIARLAPNEQEFETRYRDEDYPGGEAYYYVRLRQADNNMAWGSPIWVK